MGTTRTVGMSCSKRCSTSVRRVDSRCAAKSSSRQSRCAPTRFTRSSRKTAKRGRCGSWSLLPRDTIQNPRAPGRPYRARNLDKLWAYLHLHYTDEPARLEQRGDLCGALLVPSRTPSLDADVASLDLTWTISATGTGKRRAGRLRSTYWRLTPGRRRRMMICYARSVTTPRTRKKEGAGLLEQAGSPWRA